MGVPITTIKELMGHARIETTMRYITVNEAQLRSAIATMHSATSWQPRGSDKSKNAPELDSEAFGG